MDCLLKKKKKKLKSSSEWFRSTDLWVMGPARFRCATELSQVCDKFSMNVGTLLF